MISLKSNSGHAPTEPCGHMVATQTIVDLEPQCCCSAAEAAKVPKQTRGVQWLNNGQSCVRGTSASHRLLSGFNSRQMKLSPLSSFTLLWRPHLLLLLFHWLFTMLYFIMNYNRDACVPRH